MKEQGSFGGRLRTQALAFLFLIFLLGLGLSLVGHVLADGSLRGTVYRPDGATPQPGAFVFAQDMEGAVFPCGLSDASGNFACPPLPVSPPYSPYNIQAFSLITTYADSDARFVLLQDNFTETVTLTLTIPKITGTVRGPAGQVITEAGVVLWDEAGYPYAPLKRTRSAGPTGLYKFGRTGDFLTGTYILQAKPPSSGPGSQLADSLTQTIFYVPSQTVNIPLTLTQPSITGTVAISTTDGPAIQAIVPVTNTQVHLFRPRTPDFQPINVSTDMSGVFRFGPIATGTYALAAMAPDRPDYELYASSPHHAITYTGVPTGVGTVLLPRANITGTVRDPQGVEVTRTGVVVYTADRRTERDTGTDNSGQFKMGGLAAGTYFMMAFPPMGSPYGESAPVSVTLSNPTLITGIVLTLTIPNISGTVSLPDGSPAAMAGVSAHTEDFSTQRNAGTNMSGAFRLGGLPSGTYIVEAYPPQNLSDRFSPSAPVTVPVVARDTTTVALTLTVPSITGTVLLPNGLPASMAGVFVHNNDFSVQRHTGTNPNGRFSVGGLGTGSYLVKIFPPFGSSGYLAPDPVSVTITSTLFTVNAGVFPFQTPRKFVVGHVRTSNPGGVSNAIIFGQRMGSPGFAMATVTDAITLPPPYGVVSYVLALSPGTWMVGIGPDRGPGAPEPDWVYNRPPTSLSIDGDPNSYVTQTLDFTVTRANARLWGELRKPDGSSNFAERSTFVGAHSATGMGNGTEVRPNGVFTIPLSAGTYRIGMFSTDETLAMPSLSPVTLTDTQILNLGVITLATKTSRLNITVRDTEGTGVPDVEVQAWNREGSGWGRATTITGGVASMYVISGTWELQAMPEASSRYAPSGPPTRVTIGDNETKAANLTVVRTDATLQGRVVVSGTNAVASDLYGFVFTEGEGGPGVRGGTAQQGGPQRPMIGAPIQNGLFSMNVPSGTHVLNAGFPPGITYTLASTVPVSIQTGETRQVTLTVRANDATITGTLRNINNHLLTGVDADVMARSQGGSHQFTRADTSCGCYTMSVGADTWSLGAWHDPGASHYVVRHSTANTVTVPSGQTRPFNFTLQERSATISGTVTISGSVPVTGAVVVAEEMVTIGPWFPLRVEGETDSSGAYRLRLPGGTYRLFSFVARDRGLMPTGFATATVTATQTVTKTLHFSQPNAVITGTVLSATLPNPGFVRGYSADGSHSFVETSTGAYALNVVSGTTWYLDAIYEDGTTSWRASVITVTVNSAVVPNQNLTLGSPEAMPQPETSSFDASALKIINLSDGTQIRIPGGALAVSGTVTVIATPRRRVPIQQSVRPLGLAYNLLALNSSGQTINSFNSNVDIIIPYTDAQLAALGITEDDLIPSYWDEATSSWRAVDNAVVDKANNRVIISINHFTDFGNMGRPGEAPSGLTYRAFIPVAFKANPGGW